jgi:hypothetical protein
MRIDREGSAAARGGEDGVCPEMVFRAGNSLRLGRFNAFEAEEIIAASLGF